MTHQTDRVRDHFEEWGVHMCDSRHLMTPQNGKAGLLTVNEACRYLAVGRSTLYELMAAGEVRCVKIGSRALRVPVSELDAFIETHMTGLGQEPPALVNARRSAP